MRLAIVGAKGSGKSTLFHALTGQVPAHTGRASDPPVQVVKVKDPRLDWLGKVYEPRKFTPVAVEVCDFPGLPEPDDAQGVKLSELLAAAREADGLVICVRGFTDPTYPYKNSVPDPLREAGDVATELVLADLEITLRRLEKLDRKGGNKTDAEKREHAALGRVRDALEAGEPVKEASLSAGDLKQLRGFRFLTEKPWILVVSQPDDGGECDPEAVEGPFDSRMGLRAKLESEIGELDEEDRAMFMEDLGVEELAADSVLATAFRGLGTVCFFTTGEDECRAWPVRTGATAVEAAGTIHSDLARGFIRAEVYSWQDLKDVEGDEGAVKKAGKFRLEGKDYLVRDGDVFHVRFSV